MKHQLRPFLVAFPWLFAALFPLALSCSLSAVAAPADPNMTALVAALPSADYAQKHELVKQLLTLHDPHVRAVLQSLLDGTLYVRTRDGKVFIAAEQNSQLTLTDPITDSAEGNAPADDLEKISANNQLRKSLRVALAQFDLSRPEPAARLAAVKEMLRASTMRAQRYCANVSSWNATRT